MIETRAAAVQNVAVTDDSLMVDLVDGRTVSVPLAWYPRLLHGRPEERANWRLMGQGEGIIGPISMKTSAQRTFCSGNRRVRVNGHSAVGCNRGLRRGQLLHAFSPPDAKHPSDGLIIYTTGKLVEVAGVGRHTSWCCKKVL